MHTWRPTVLVTFSMLHKVDNLIGTSVSRITRVRIVLMFEMGSGFRLGFGLRLALGPCCTHSSSCILF